MHVAFESRSGNGRQEAPRWVGGGGSIWRVSEMAHCRFPDGVSEANVMSHFSCWDDAFFLFLVVVQGGVGFESLKYVTGMVYDKLTLYKIRINNKILSFLLSLVLQGLVRGRSGMLYSSTLMCHE